MSIRYLSLCSGIEAFSCAVHDMPDFVPVAFSEIEPFPCKVLAHHYPDVPNLGDMTKIDGSKYRGAVDLIVGGTPCQDFSIAGTRKGLAGERSGLAMHFVRLVAEIHPRWILWENVPGCLTTNKGNDFKQFIGALHECGFCLSWRILDAQFFGTPQRRRRVFVVGHSGEIANPLKVLFESYSLPRNTTQGEKKRKRIAEGSGTGTLDCCVSKQVNNQNVANGFIIPSPPASERESRNPDTGIRQARSNVQRHGDCGAYYTKQALGEYKQCGLASTLSRRDYKDATDLIVNSDAPA